MSRNAQRHTGRPAGICRPKDKIPGFQKIAECIGGAGCIYLRKAGNAVTLKNSANNQELVMTTFEWRQICAQKRRGEI